MPRLLPLLLLLAFLASCGSSLEFKTERYEQGSLLILPPRDAFEDAKPGSGDIVGLELATEFAARGWQADRYEPDAKLGHANPIQQDQAVAAGAAVGADFALTVVLGKARDAGGFTGPISDYVWLDEATLYDCSSGRAVWTLLEPFRADSSNFAHLGPSYRGIAILLSDSITEQAGEESMSTLD